MVHDQEVDNSAEQEQTNILSTNWSCIAYTEWAKLVAAWIPLFSPHHHCNSHQPDQITFQICMAIIWSLILQVPQKECSGECLSYYQGPLFLEPYRQSVLHVVDERQKLLKHILHFLYLKRWTNQPNAWFAAPVLWTWTSVIKFYIKPTPVQRRLPDVCIFWGCRYPVNFQKTKALQSGTTYQYSRNHCIDSMEFWFIFRPT